MSIGPRKSPIQLENINRRLRFQVADLSDQLNNSRESFNHTRERYNVLQKEVKDLISAIFNSEYVENPLEKDKAIAGMDIIELVRRAREKHQEIHTTNREFMLNLALQIKEKEREAEDLRVQISRIMAREAHAKKYSEVAMEATHSPEKETPKQENPVEEMATAKIAIIDDDIDDVVEKVAQKEEPKNKKSKKDTREHQDKPVPIAKNLKQEETSDIIASHVTEEKRSEDRGSTAKTNPTGRNREDANRVTAKADTHTEVKSHIVNLNEYIAKISDIMWEVMQAIGEQGLSESKDIKRQVVKNNITESAFNTALAQLRKMGVIEQEKISTGWRWFHSYELSDIGSRIYLEKFKKNPVDCEKQILVKEHATALHGYCIKDTAEILKAIFGYDEAVMDRARNSVKVFSGETYIPDVVARRREGSLVDYFEVELGHHTQADFNKKCNKMLMVTKNLYFVVPYAEIMNRVLAKQIGQWVLDKGGKDRLRGVTIYLTTLKKLNDGKWENIYPF